jgi:hypothetical protein
MSDPQELDSGSIEKRLGRSLGDIWSKHSGGAAGDVEISIEGNVVRSRICGAEEHSPQEAAYTNAATRAVHDATGRRVKAFIPKYDSKAELTTQTYILEKARVYN